MTSQVVIRMASDLKKASAKNNAPIWRKLAEYALNHQLQEETSISIESVN